MRKQIIEILTEICPGIDFENETALIDDGLIDSLDIVAVVTELMEAFDVELGVDDLTPENFNSVDAIVELIESEILGSTLDPKISLSENSIGNHPNLNPKL